MVPLSEKNNFLHRDRPLSWKCNKIRQPALTLFPRLHLFAPGQMKMEWQGEVHKATLVTGEGGVAQSGSHFTRLHLCYHQGSHPAPAVHLLLAGQPHPPNPHVAPTLPNLIHLSPYK